MIAATTGLPTRERPILFSGPMVRAILEGRKTQTRRAVKLPADATEFFDPLRVEYGDGHSGPGAYLSCGEYPDEGSLHVCCPYGQPGDRLWVKETFIHSPATYVWEASTSVPAVPAETIFRADADPNGEEAGAGWRPSIFMPRHLSRLTLEVTGVRVEALGQMSYHDALAEGIYQDSAGFHWKEPAPTLGWADPRHAYADLWENINGKGTVDANPWVWVVEFRRLAP